MNFNLILESIRGSYILLVKWRQIFQQWYIWHLCKTSKGVASISSCHTCVDASDVMEELLNANDWESIAGNTFCYLTRHLHHHHLRNHKDQHIKHTVFTFKWKPLSSKADGGAKNQPLVLLFKQSSLEDIQSAQRLKNNQDLTITPLFIIIIIII